MCLQGFAGKVALKWHIKRKASHQLCYLLLPHPQLFLLTFSHLHLGKPVNDNYFLHIQNISFWHKCCWFIRKQFSQKQMLIWKWDQKRVLCVKRKCWLPIAQLKERFFLEWTISLGVILLSTKKRSSRVKKKYTAEGFYSLGFCFLDFFNLRFYKPCTHVLVNFKVFAYLSLLTGLIYSSAYISMV